MGFTDCRSYSKSLTVENAITHPQTIPFPQTQFTFETTSQTVRSMFEITWHSFYSTFENNFVFWDGNIV